MLFDLEDYAASGFFGNPNGHYINGVGFDGIAIPPVTGKQHAPYHWEDAEGTFRATRDAYMKATNEYILSGLYFSAVSEKPAILAAELDIYTKFKTFLPISKNFWNALKTMAAKDAGFNEGDNISFLSKENANNYGISGYDFECIQDRSMEFVTYTAFLVNDSLPSGLNFDAIPYTEMTQELYDSYSEAFKAWMGAYKGLYLAIDGSTFEEYVAPPVPAWDSYPELSGYVRGTNSLSIKDAVVRLVDADGVNHDVVTDVNGYYKFDKEMFYNTIAFDHGATASNFNMFVLDHTFGSTASLYDTTSIYQNSFFGAENNREFTWPVSVRMGKPARRNFKLEFLPDYSNYPSFSGYVKDANGNGIKDAFVIVKDPNSGVAIGQYKKPNGDYAWNFKYNDFGTDKTILTDENGFYEYTSQMVGEWFNKYGFTQHEMPTTIISEPTRTYEDMQRWLMSNEFIVYLIPYTQNADATSMVWDGTPIYNSNDYNESRFEYALSNSHQQFYYRDIEMGNDYEFNVDVKPAVGNEVMADKIKMTCTPGSKNISGEFHSTTGYVKFVFSNEVSEVRSNGWSTFQYNEYEYDTTMFSNEFYVYSCDNQGRASGYITKLFLGDTESSNVSNVDFSETEQLARLTIYGYHASEIDLSGLNKLYELYLIGSYYLESVSGLQDSKYLSRIDLESNQYLNSFPLVNKDWLSQFSINNNPALLSLDLSTIGKKTTSIDLNLNILENIQSVNLGFIGHTASSYLGLNIYDCNSLLVDDVDIILQQLADSGKNVNFYTDKARSSDSDVAYDTLINRGCNIGLGSEYFEFNETKKSVVFYVDPSFGPDSNSESKSIYINGQITTTTGYFRVKSWFNTGNPNNNNIYSGSFNRYIDVQFDDTFESRPIEIYSTDQYGRPSGSITSIDFCPTPNDTCKNIVAVDLSQATEITYLGVRNSGMTSLDITSNVLLESIFFLNLGKLTSIDVTGLDALNNLYFENINSLVNIEGIETLVGLTDISLINCQELDFVSLSTFDSVRIIDLNNVFKYDSTHVDTMLSELNANSVAGVASLDSQIAIKQPEVDALTISSQQAIDAYNAKSDEVQNLMNSGADQSLIDVAQAELDILSASNLLIKDQKNIALQELDTLQTQRQNYFSGRQLKTYSMARTSASDADYDSLIAFGWNLYLGDTFFAPYTLPVKGYITLDWDGNDQRYLQLNNLVTTNEYYTFKDGKGNLNSGSGDNFSLYADKGVLEFWSTDSFGRAGGQFTGFNINSDYVISTDFDNLTSLTTLTLRSIKSTTIDVSNLSNLTVFECLKNKKITSITGLNLLTNLERFVLVDCTKLANVDTSGFESLTTLYLEDNSSLTDIDISTFSSLTSLTINKQNFETPKHLDVHVNINNINYDLFRTFTSADLDTLLAELDVNGQSNGTLSTGFTARTEASDVAYNNLQSKGWNLGLGSYFIGPNEAPAKGYIHFEDTTVNEPIGFYVNSETNYFVVKYPNGSTETRNDGWIYYDFNNSIPAEERIIEVYGTDQFGRPTDSITNITDNDKCSSVDFSALKKLRSVGLDLNNRITTLNLDGVVSLEGIFVNSCPLLETISIVGCTASKRDLYMNSCPSLDIDAFLIQLDETGSLPHEYGCTIHADEQWGNGFTPARTNASDAAVESLQNKGFDIRVVEPAGDTLVFSVDNSWNNKDLRIGTNTGYFKIVFPVGSQLREQYPNGVIHDIRQNNMPRKFNFGALNEVSNDIVYAPIEAGRLNDYATNVRFWEYDIPTTMNIEIYSCSEHGVPSGDITLLFIGSGLRPLTTMSKVIALRLNPDYGVSWNDTTYTNYSNAYSNISFTGMTSLKYFGLYRGTQALNFIGANYPSTFNVNLTGSDVKHLCLVSEFSTSKNINLVGVTKSSLVSLNYRGFNMGNLNSSYSSLTYLRATRTQLGSCNLTSTPLKKIYIEELGESGNNGNLSSLQLPSTLVDAYFGLFYSGLRGNLDLSGLTNLTSLNMRGYNEQSDDNGSSANILGLSSLQSLSEIRLTEVSTSNLNLSGLPITWIDFSDVNQYRSSFVADFSNLSPNLRYVSLRNMPTLSGDLSFDIRITDSYPSGFNMENCDQVTSLTFARVIAGAWISRNDLLSTITFGTEGGNYIGYDYDISNNKVLSSIVNARATYLYLRENLSSSWNGNGWSSVCLLDGAPFDAIMQTLADSGRYSGYFYSSGVKRTHASDSAKATLLSRSWSVYRDGGSEFV